MDYHMVGSEMHHNKSKNAVKGVTPIINSIAGVATTLEILSRGHNTKRIEHHCCDACAKYLKIDHGYIFH